MILRPPSATPFPYTSLLRSITLTITYISTNLFIVLGLQSEISAVTIQLIGICILHARCLQYIAVLQYTCGYY